MEVGRLVDRQKNRGGTETDRRRSGGKGGEARSGREREKEKGREGGSKEESASERRTKYVCANFTKVTGLTPLLLHEKVKSCCDLI